jgi:hypothetical protein
VAVVEQALDQMGAYEPGTASHQITSHPRPLQQSQNSYEPVPKRACRHRQRRFWPTISSGRISEHTENAELPKRFRGVGTPIAQPFALNKTEPNFHCLQGETISSDSSAQWQAKSRLISKILH